MHLKIHCDVEYIDDVGTLVRAYYELLSTLKEILDWKSPTYYVLGE